MKSFLTTGLAILGALTVALVPAEAQLLTTRGMIVASPYQNMGVYQGGYMSISFKLQGKSVGATTVTMAKKDGSSNTTLYTVPATQSAAQFLESYPVPLTVETGDYRVSIIAQPGSDVVATTTRPATMTSSTAGGAAPTAAGLAWQNGGFVILAPSPTTSGDASTPSGAPDAPSVFTYAVDVRVLAAKEKPQPPNSALTLSQSAGQIAWKAAAAMGCVALVALTL